MIDARSGWFPVEVLSKEARTKLSVCVPIQLLQKGRGSGWLHGVTIRISSFRLTIRVLGLGGYKVFDIG